MACSRGPKAPRGTPAGNTARVAVPQARQGNVCRRYSDTAATTGISDIYGFAAIENTAQNRSSMLQDVLAGRKTEIEFINGHMLRTARRLDVDAPLNQELLQEVIALGQ